MWWVRLNVKGLTDDYFWQKVGLAKDYRFLPVLNGFR